MALEIKENGITYHVDSVRSEGNRLIVNGFAGSSERVPVEFLVKDSVGRIVSGERVSIVRLNRSDVSLLLYGDASTC